MTVFDSVDTTGAGATRAAAAGGMAAASGGLAQADH